AEGGEPAPHDPDPRSSGSWSVNRSRNAALAEVRSPGSGIRPPIQSQSFDSSRSVSAMPRIRAIARPSASASASAAGTSTARTGRSSSETENLANGNSSFQRRSLRSDLGKEALFGGPYRGQQV